MKFRCVREIVSAEGSQEFEVEAKSIEEAKEKFKSGGGELVSSDCEVMDLSDYDLDSVWEET